MKIRRNTIARVQYTVTNAANGMILQDVSGEQLQEFLFGYQLLLDIFERKLLGLSPGDSFHFHATRDEAYGPVDPKAIVDLPVSTFADEDGRIDEEALQVGNVFPMGDRQGNQLYGKIIRIENDQVIMDFNHPMAGKDLLFSGKIIAVREALPEELPE
ncbi:FKBP-type peptidyl-prolyl cis-trans isomerase [Gaoshiqia sp. Z1-71]|uniref:FKBP-type peptidyl-prolyl cis-trans isomerase n=1 Tax=Gaoshiqia hydrogeniformans TaxID=3290090 RepID=UPI003BF819CD